MSITFEANACLCASPAAGIETTRTGDHNFGRTSEKAMFLRCPDCGSLFPAIFPTRQSLGEAYQAYYTAPTRRGAIKRALRSLVNAGKKDHLLRGTPPAARSVLDYGCGSGEFLRQLAAQGRTRRLAGTDITRPGEAELRGIDWIELDGLDETPASFDWITLNHVIEHLADPGRVLQQLRRLLAPGGGLWIATPNAEAFLIASFGAYARDLDFPRHRQIFSARALTAMLEQAGYGVSQVSSPRIDTLLNFLSCARNVMATGEMSAGRKALLIARSATAMLKNLLSSQALRMRSAPELVFVARARGTPGGAR